MNRSWLFVPGDDLRKISKGMAGEADALILDLEDSVAPARKPEARLIVAEALAGPRAGAPQLWVRVNALDTGLTQGDLEAVLGARPDGIFLPKSESGGSIDALRDLARPICARFGTDMPPIVAIATETAAALFGLGSYGQAGLAGLTWGAEDLSAALGASTSRDENGCLTPPFAMARTLALAGAVAAGCQPIDTVWVAIKDSEGLIRECREAVRDGFTGKMAIHPNQVAIINEAFRPNAEELAQAREIVDAFAANPDLGVVAINGKMVDMPHLKRALGVLARAR